MARYSMWTTGRSTATSNASARSSGTSTRPSTPSRRSTASATGTTMIRKAKRYISPITQRILAVNLSALLILAFGLLYSGQYEREMINGEQNSLQVEGRLLSAALAGGGVRETLDGNPVLTQDLSLHMLRQLE